MPDPDSPQSIPTAFQKKTFWLALTGLSGTVIFALLIAFLWLAGIILGYLQQVLLPIAIAGIIAYLLEPLVSWLERRKMNRTMAVSSVLVAFLGVAALIITTIVPPIVDQTSDIVRNKEQILGKSTQFFEDSLKNPYVEKAVNHYYERSLEMVQKHSATRDNWLGEVISSLTGKKEAAEEEATQVLPAAKLNLTAEEKALYSGTGNAIPGEASAPALPAVGSAVAAVDSGAGRDAVDKKDATSDSSHLDAKQKLIRALENNSAAYGKILMGWFSSGREIISGGIGWIIGSILVPIFVFVFLKDSVSIREKWMVILPIRNSRFKEEVVATLTEINGYLIAFFRGQMIVSLIDGMLIGLSLWILGMPYAFIIGAAVGVLGIVPYVGIFSVFVPTLLLSWFVWHDWQHLVWVSGIFLVCNQFDSWFIQPKIVGNAVGLHEVTVIFSVIFWSFIFGGIVGALLAVPLTASVKVIFQRYIWENIKERSKVLVGDDVAEPPPLGGA